MRGWPAIALCVAGLLSGTAGCESRSLQQQPSGTSSVDAGGPVALNVMLPPSRSFCDPPSCYPIQHVSIHASDGTLLTYYAGAGCLPTCSDSCQPIVCPTLCPADDIDGARLTDLQLIWDGRFTKMSTCGGGITCVDIQRVPPGSYVATFCVTPGDVSGPDGGRAVTCTQTGPQECMDVPFSYPGPGVNVWLPTPDAGTRDAATE
ncbi:MAG TPA: hypothetical protein VKZ18_12530 [Polyangia bacterium]|nr:hypothetical protein [Polyangia bacterium]